MGGHIAYILIEKPLNKYISNLLQKKISTIKA